MSGFRVTFSWVESSFPFMGMLLAVTSLATNMIVSKMAMSNGTSNFILSVYSNALATLILFPCGFLFHRSKNPPLTFPILCRIFLLAIFGCLADIGSYAGIKYSSPTLGTELLNLVPGFTYILAVIFRMEKFSLRRSSDVSKSLGTIISIFGASVVTLYKGPAIINKTPLTSNHSSLFSSTQQNWILGGILLAIAAFSTASWSIVQTTILKIYPAKMIVVAVYCLFVTMQSAIVALISEKDSMAWKLRAEMGLFAVFYAVSFYWIDTRNRDMVYTGDTLSSANTKKSFIPVVKLPKLLDLEHPSLLTVENVIESTSGDCTSIFLVSKEDETLYWFSKDKFNKFVVNKGSDVEELNLIGIVDLKSKFMKSWWDEIAEHF